MADTITMTESAEASYCGLRMDADEFLEILDDGNSYELIDGVVIMSPSPKPVHQRVAFRIALDIGKYLEHHPIGEVLPEIDVHLGQSAPGRDLVYCPELVFIRAERLPQMHDKIFGAPDLVVEVISKGSRRYDSETKKADYERFGVKEYWLIDPERKAMTFYRLQDGKYAVVSPDGDHFTSDAVPGFVLDLARVRETFKPW